MWGYIYDRSGEPVAVKQGEHIFDMDGIAIGYVQGSHVYKMDGDYVGELYRDMIVDQYLSNPGNMGRVMDPGKIGRADNPGNRGPMDYGYPDVVSKLLDY